MNFTEQYNLRVARIDRHIEACLQTFKNADKTMIDAIKYCVLSGGKRVRSILLTECAEMLGSPTAPALDLAAAVEFIHAYSLVHDDLPCMDNDNERRGMPSCHIKYGEAAAILTGDGLLNLAFELMANSAVKNGVNSLKAMAYIAEKSGISGMIKGQMIDIEMMNKADISIEMLEELITNKTSALICAAAVGGGICAGCDGKTLDLLEAFSYNFGMAFQIRDDIEDGAQDYSEDSSPNFLNILGENAAHEKLRYHYDKSIEILQKFPNSSFLIELSKYLFTEN